MLIAMLLIVIEQLTQQVVYATAVVLTINIPFFAKLDGAQIAVAFFEVGAKIVYAEFSSNARAYLVDKGRVFVRTDGEGGGKEVKVVTVRL